MGPPIAELPRHREINTPDYWNTRIAPRIQQLPPEDQADIECAYRIAYSAHRDQLRASGEPVISHPVAVTEILLDVGVTDPVVLAGALLHDVMEDTNLGSDSNSSSYGYAKLRLVFNGSNEIAQITSDLSAPDFTKLQISKEKADEMYHAFIPDMSVNELLIKMADRIHNIQTLHAIPWIKRSEKVTETETHYMLTFRGLARVNLQARKLLKLLEKSMSIAKKGLSPTPIDTNVIV